MEPIVSPWLIYIISVTGSIKFIIGMILFCLVIWTIAVGVCSIDDDVSEESRANSKRAFKRLLCRTITVAFLFALIPTKEDAIAMTVASFITPDNLSSAKDVAIDVIKDIVDAINSSI